MTPGPYYRAQPFPRRTPDQNRGPEVETALLRAAFERSGVSKGELARRLGWMRPNIDQVNRALGYRPDSNSRKPGVRLENRVRMSYRLATRIARALPGIDPRECDV
jgi:hypothetical protein